MADFAMDYERLWAMQRGLHRLGERAETAGGVGAWEDVGSGTATSNEEVFGDYDLAYQFQLFYGKSKVRIEEGKDKLARFGNMFGDVANTLFEQDAQIAASVAVSAADSIANNWRSQHEAVEQWEQHNDEWNSYLEGIGADEYFREHPDANIYEVCAGDGGPEWCQTWRDDYPDRPVPPGDRPQNPEGTAPDNHFQWEDEDGGKTDVVLTYDEDFNIVQEQVTVETPDGETYVTTIDYDGPPDYSEPDENGDVFDRRDYVVSTTGPDGTTTVESVTVNDDGSGTQSKSNSTSTNDDGEEETEYAMSETTYHDDGGETTVTRTFGEDGSVETNTYEVTVNDDGTEGFIDTTTHDDGSQTQTIDRDGVGPEEPYTHTRQDGDEQWEVGDAGLEDDPTEDLYDDDTWAKGGKA